MNDDYRSEPFEIQVSDEYLERIESDLGARPQYVRTEEITAYNRGGGPAGQYDRHYDKSTGDD